MKLLLKYPTRQRPQQFKETLNKYYDMLSGKVEFQFFISVDNDDPTMNNPEMKSFMESNRNLSYYFGDNKTKIQAVNADMDKVQPFDVLLLLSDDMLPKVVGYDKIICDDMLKHFSNLDGVLHYNDGECGKRLNTLSIMGSEFYKEYGYIYYPEYRSFYCDNEFTEVTYRTKKAVYIDKVIIEHQKRTNMRAPDSLYRRNSRENSFDKQLFAKRKANDFK